MRILLLLTALLVMPGCATSSKADKPAPTKVTLEKKAPDPKPTKAAAPDEEEKAEKKESKKKESKKLEVPELKRKCEHSKNSFACVTYVKNYDADTITFNIDGVHPFIGQSIDVRVRGIDAPEMRGGNSCSRIRAIEAKLVVEELLRRAKRIDLLNISKGKYFRVVADVQVDGVISLSKVLIDAKLAYAYKGRKKSKIDWCQPLQKRSRKPANSKPTK